MSFEPVLKISGKANVKMKLSKSKWLAYTVLVGLIPVFSRLVTWAVASAGVVNPLSPADFVAFGLVLHISIINEIEHVPDEDGGWKSTQNGTSIFFITMYMALYAIIILGERNAKLIDPDALIRSSIIFAGFSLILSFTVFHRLSKLK